MKSVVRRIGLAALLVAVLALAAIKWDALFNIVVRVPLLGWFAAYNIPPADYYVPRGESPLRVGRSSLVFRCKYRGRHEIRIQGGICTNRLWKSNVGMDVFIRDSRGAVLFSISRMNARIMGGANGRYKYCYAIFYAPKDVPIDVDLTVEVFFYGDVDNLLRQFPAAEVVVTKAFDK